MSAPPLPTADGVVVVPAPGRGPGHWAGAPSATLDDDGGWTDLGEVLRGTPGTWDARGARVTAVLSRGPSSCSKTSGSPDLTTSVSPSPGET